jgi:CRP-like cAMP-binding protein
VAEATTTITLDPHSILFRAGDDGSSGIFVVVEGCLGMFLPDGEGLAETNKLMPGESVGDLDVIDGAPPCCLVSKVFCRSARAGTRGRCRNRL